jgi:phosphoenolpyruvate carboxylase
LELAFLVELKVFSRAMNPTQESPALRSGFEKIDEDLAFLIDTLAEVLTDLGEEELALCLPWRSQQPALPEPLPTTAGQAYSIAFQLLNMVEENAAAVFRGLREEERGAATERGLWGATVREMKEAGAGVEDFYRTLDHLRVEPVLTAHPTEAKRLSVLEQHRVLYQLLSGLNRPEKGAFRDRLRRELRTALERLWRTGETHLRRPKVSDERRNLLYYLTEVFPRALPGLDARLEEALDLAGWTTKPLWDSLTWPRLRFGTWVGGDRDGHPFVTSAVTDESLRELRQGAFKVLLHKLEKLRQVMTLSGTLQPPPSALLERFVPRSAEPPENEPWRYFVQCMIERLQHTSGLSPSSPDLPPYASPSDLQEDLAALVAGLQEIGARRLARRDVRPIQRCLDVFGFHLAALDIRQNSRFHRLALGQLMDAAGLPGQAFAHEWNEEQRRAFLEAELQSSRPFLPAGQQDAGEESAAVLSSYRVLVHHIQQHGLAGLGSLIVSMTTGVSDLLSVYVLAREAGLCRLTETGLACALPVVPLFETLADLEAGPTILADFLSHPVTQATLCWQKEARASSRPIEQQVMVGYSDSCKDAGILASQWGLHRAQKELSQLAAVRDTAICFFHGRGGTVSRGAGPTHRFLEALPHGALGGSIRLTEQGETVAQKFANLETATFNLELLLAGVTKTTWAHEQATGSTTALEEEGAPLMTRLARASQQTYRDFLRDPEFMTFYRQATPIDALEHCQIGSRPARRTGAATLDDLRAIPWVFSWNQSRFYLPGWFGVGSALAACGEEDLTLLTRLLREWPFANYAFTNIEASVASSDAELMQLYGNLVAEEAVREKFLSQALAERQRTAAFLDKLYGAPFATRRPRMAKTLALRAEALRILHEQQVHLLRQWRQARQENSPLAQSLMPALTLSVNAIASGLRTTG